MLDIWFREDILHALQAADQASATTAAAMESVVGDPRYLCAYREGYRAALVTVAMAFGIDLAAAGSAMTVSTNEALDPVRSPHRAEVRQKIFA